MVEKLLSRAGITTREYRRKPGDLLREANEWTIRELAAEIGMPGRAPYAWVQQGRLHSRRVPIGRGYAKLVQADGTTIGNLKAIRATPDP
jgi:hypothetical protein